jgi:hypothetical protein
MRRARPPRPHGPDPHAAASAPLRMRLGSALLAPLGMGNPAWVGPGLAALGAMPLCGSGPWGGACRWRHEKAPRRACAEGLGSWPAARPRQEDATC